MMMDSDNKMGKNVWWSGFGTTAVFFFLGLLINHQFNIKWLIISLGAGSLVLCIYFSWNYIKRKRMLEISNNVLATDLSKVKSEMDDLIKSVSNLKTDNDTLAFEKADLENKYFQLIDERTLMDDENAMMIKLNRALSECIKYYKDMLFYPSNKKSILPRVLASIQMYINGCISIYPNQPEINVSLFIKSKDTEELIIYESTKHSEETKVEKKFGSDSLVFYVYKVKEPAMSDDVTKNKPFRFSDVYSNGKVNFSSILCIPIYNEEKDLFCGVLCITGDVPLVEIYENNTEYFENVKSVIVVLKKMNAF